MIDFDDQLAKSCGQIRPMILHARHQDHRTLSKYVITKPYAIIGRNSSCDISLNHEDVSKQHAYLQVLDGKLFCVDQGSRHGIFWKDTPQLYGWVLPGQHIEIGPFEITLEQPVGIEEGNRNLRNTAPFFAKYSPRVPSNAILEINGNKQFDLRHQLALIGRCKHCNIILDTGEISPIHASIVRTLDGKYWLVVPIGIKVKVNHKRCVSMELHDEDVITIGNHTLTFRIVQHPVDSGVLPLRNSSSINLQTDEEAASQLPNPPHTPAPSLIEFDSAIARKLEHQPVADLESALAQSIFLDRSSIEQIALPVAGPEESGSALVQRRSSSPTAPKSVQIADELVHQHSELSGQPAQGDAQLVSAFTQHMQLMQKEMMTQMRMNMEMMAEFMVNLQQQHMDQVREEMTYLAKINQELMQLRQSLLTPQPVVKETPIKLSSKQQQLPSKEPTGEKQPVSKPKFKLPVEEQPSHPHSHDWISKRIAVLEGERQTRWEKMKSAVLGK